MFHREVVLDGLTPLFYPFLSGLLISRIGKFIKMKGGFWLCSPILIVLFSIPCVGGAGNVMNGIYNAVCFLLVFPIVVMMSAGCFVLSIAKAYGVSAIYVPQSPGSPVNGFILLLSHITYVRRLISPPLPFISAELFF